MLSAINVHNDLPTKLEEKVNSAVSIIGETFSSPVDETADTWRICKTIKVGKLTATQFAHKDGIEDRGFVHKWSDRNSIFPQSAFFNGASIFFDGNNDSLNAGNSFNLDNANQHSIVKWIRPDNLSVQRALYSKTTVDSNVFGTGWYHDSSGKFFLQVRASGQLRSFTGSLTLDSQQWQMVALTFLGNQNMNGYRLYKNDTVDTVPGSAAITNTLLYDQDALFGRRGSAFLYSGHMDEISFWNKALSQAEVTALYNLGVPTNIADPTVVPFNSSCIGFWRADGDISPTLLDNIGVTNLTMEFMNQTNIDEEEFA